MKEINTGLLLNNALFQEIHQLKDEFISLFSDIANQISDQELAGFDTKHKGKKISKGNELQHCPYQVLDLVRNFDKETGFNIRILNWWGHGLYIMVYHGASKLPSQSCYQDYLKAEYQLCLTGSPWDYKSIIIHNQQTSEHSFEQLSSHLRKVKHLQMIKSLRVPSSAEQLRNTLLEEWRLLKKFHHNQ
ncbi:hypothetical protein GCM10028791_04570 [Echinicola sediminis]